VTAPAAAVAALVHLTGSTVCPGANCNDDTVSPGVLGFAVVLAMGAAVYLLIRSFRKQMRKVPPTFDPPTDPADESSPAAPTGVDASTGSEPAGPSET
jgi:hypothetical protein